MEDCPLSPSVWLFSTTHKRWVSGGLDGAAADTRAAIPNPRARANKAPAPTGLEQLTDEELDELCAAAAAAAAAEKDEREPTP
jgi:hypothetical protein